MNSEKNRKIDIDSYDSDSSLSDNKGINNDIIDSVSNQDFSVLMSPLLSKNLDDILLKINCIETNLLNKFNELSIKIDDVSEKINLDKKYRDFNTIHNSALHENNLFLNNQIIGLHKFINENKYKVNDDIKVKINDILTKKLSFDNNSYMSGI